MRLPGAALSEGPAVAGFVLLAAAGLLALVPAAAAVLPAEGLIALAALGFGLMAGGLAAGRTRAGHAGIQQQMAEDATRHAGQMADLSGLALNDGTTAWPGWHWETDRSGCLVAASEGLVAGLGRPIAELAGTPFSQLFPADGPGSGWHRLVLAIEAGKPVSCPVELPLHGGNGWWQVTARPFFDRDGRRAGMRGVARDISRERAAQRQWAAELAESHRLDRRKSKFMAAIAEQLRGPVNTLAGAAAHLEAAPDRAAGGPPDRRLLETMLDASSRLQQLVAVIADTTRLEAGQMKLAEQEADAAEIAEIAVKLCRETAAAADVTVVASLIDGIELRCDVSRIKQVLMSLIATAIAWSPAGSTVHVDFELEAGAGGLAITVAPEATAPPCLNPADLLKPFGSDAPDALELPIARQIALLHGGDMTMETAATGYAAFRLELPASRVSAGATDTATLYSAA